MSIIAERSQFNRFTYSSRVTRLKLLQEISANEDFSVPAFLFFSHEATKVESVSNLAKMANDHLNDAPICRPCPVDEIFSLGLSFAGIFPTYIPNHQLSFHVNVQAGVEKVFNDNGRDIDYYYNVHRANIPSVTKERHLIMMELIHNLIIHGTAYVYPDIIRTCYAVRPKGLTGETNLQVLSLGFDPTDTINSSANTDRDIGYSVASKIRRPLNAILDVSETPIDIEYLIDSDQKLWIVQARPISDAHLRLYQQVKSLNQKNLNNVNDSALFNSCGEIKGEVYDMRNLRPCEVDRNRFIDKGAILLICHQQHGFFSTKDLLKKVELEKISARILIDHQNVRGSDHLQYLVAEDPNIAFSFQSGSYENLELIDGDMVFLISDGVHLKRA